MSSRIGVTDTPYVESGQFSALFAAEVLLAVTSDLRQGERHVRTGGVELHVVGCRLDVQLGPAASEPDELALEAGWANQIEIGDDLATALANQDAPIVVVVDHLSIVPGSDLHLRVEDGDGSLGTRLVDAGLELGDGKSERSRLSFRSDRMGRTGCRAEAQCQQQSRDEQKQVLPHTKTTFSWGDCGKDSTYITSLGGHTSTPQW